MPELIAVRIVEYPDGQVLLKLDTPPRDFPHGNNGRATVAVLDDAVPGEGTRRLTVKIPIPPTSTLTDQ